MGELGGGSLGSVGHGGGGIQQRGGRYGSWTNEPPRSAPVSGGGGPYLVSSGGGGQTKVSTVLPDTFYTRVCLNRFAKHLRFFSFVRFWCLMNAHA